MQEADLYPEMPASRPRAGGRKKRFFPFLFVLTVLVVGGCLVVQKGSIFSPGRSLGGATSTPGQPSAGNEKKEIEKALAAVGKLMLLPKDDDPVLARVEDPDALASQQAFFMGAQKGDTLLIFPKSQRAILYSSSRNLIVNSGPIIAGDQTNNSVTATPKDDSAATNLGSASTTSKKK